MDITVKKKKKSSMLLIKSVIPGQTDSRVPLPEHGCRASVES